MAFCIKADSAKVARLILIQLNYKLGLGPVAGATLAFASTLDDATAYVGHDGTSWVADNEPWGEPLSLPRFVEQYQGDLEVLEMPQWPGGYRLSTKLATTRVDDFYRRLQHEGLGNAERQIIAALEKEAEKAATVEVVADTLTTSLLKLDGQAVAIREGDVEEATAFLRENSDIFREIFR